MPYINTKVSIPLSENMEKALAKKMGEAITLFPGKTEKWLMLNFEDNCHLWLGGDNTESTAFVDVSVLGAANPEAYEKMTEFICKSMEDVCKIHGNRVYVRYSETLNWGFNGKNF